MVKPFSTMEREKRQLTKETLRRDLLARRQALDPKRAARSSALVLERVRALTAWRNARIAMLYWPIRNEVDVRPLMAECWSRGVGVLMPRCRKDAPGLMDVARVDCDQDLKPGAHSIMEPCPGTCPATPCDADIILVPAVAFDVRGFRVGFGGGYYDRFLEDPALENALFVGVCHAFQLVERIPEEDHDLPVDLVITPEHTLETR